MKIDLANTLSTHLLVNVFESSSGFSNIYTWYNAKMHEYNIPKQWAQNIKQGIVNSLKQLP